MGLRVVALPLCLEFRVGTSGPGLGLMWGNLWEFDQVIHNRAPLKFCRASSTFLGIILFLGLELQLEYNISRCLF